MSDQGYTLTETLAALAILALAIGGLSAGVQVLARQQAQVGAVVLASESARAVQATLERMFEGRGPFGAHQPERFRGDGQGFAFACGLEAPCTVALARDERGAALVIAEGARSRRLALPADEPVRFAYRGALGASDAWPPARPQRQALQSLSLVRVADPAGPGLATARVWTEQPAYCQFDVILQDCR